MRALGTLARKELSALFQSSVAMLFLGVFLLFTLFTFFSTSAFFARNLADVRPLFAWLPARRVRATLRLRFCDCRAHRKRKASARSPICAT